MSLWDRVSSFLAIEPMQERTTDLAVEFDSLDDQLLAIRRRQLGTRPWRQASIREALGVPSIFGAVNMLANLTGSLTMSAMRDELEVDPDDRPQIIVRPDPLTIPREFYRGTAYNLASRGEAWWWVCKRDTQGRALSLWNVAPHEVTVEEDPNDRRYPIIRWGNKVYPNEDMRQLVYSREPGELRGVGPLQMCGAAVSVAVESQEWAANTYADGGRPSIAIKSAVELDKDEADLLREQWIDSPANVPRVIDPGIEEIQEFGEYDRGTGMLQARDYQNGETARMFNMPGSLLDYAVSGSSLTYQNIGEEFTKLVRQCLRPNYLEVIEQTMSDLLTRSTVARFKTDTLTLADIKTRYEVYGLGIDKGIIDAEEARRFEGYAPGDVENAAVPFSPPAAIPTVIPIKQRSAEVRCDGRRVRNGLLVACGKLLAEQGPFVGTCPRCKTQYAA